MRITTTAKEMHFSCVKITATKNAKKAAHTHTHTRENNKKKEINPFAGAATN